MDVPAPKRRLPIPRRLDDLDAPGRFLLWSLRAWDEGLRRGGDVATSLRGAFEAVGAGEGYIALDRLLCVVRCSASRPLTIHDVGAPCLTIDEARLLDAVSRASIGDLAACRATFAALLCPAGARLAVLPAWGVARALDLAGEGRDGWDRAAFHGDPGLALIQ